MGTLAAKAISKTLYRVQPEPVTQTWALVSVGDCAASLQESSELFPKILSNSSQHRLVLVACR